MSFDEIERIEDIKIKTTKKIYAIVISVYGKRKPKICLKIDNDYEINCETTEEIARRIGGKFRAWLGLSGDALINLSTNKIEKFQIKDILPFESGNQLEKFEELSNKIGHYFNDIEDVNGYIEDIRAERLHE